MIGFYQEDFLNLPELLSWSRAFPEHILGGEISYLPGGMLSSWGGLPLDDRSDIDLKVAGSSLDVNDPESSQLKVFAPAALTENLSLKASYSISWVEYDISDLNVENKTDGLTLKIQYQFYEQVSPDKLRLRSGL